MSSDTVTDSRTHPRKKVHWRAFILLPDGSKLPGQVINVSDGGLGLLSPRSFAAKTRLEVAIGVPQPQDASKLHIVTTSITVQYAVLSGEHFQLGARFNELSEADKQRIHDSAYKRPA